MLFEAYLEIQSEGGGDLGSCVKTQGDLGVGSKYSPFSQCQTRFARWDATCDSFTKFSRLRPSELTIVGGQVQFDGEKVSGGSFIKDSGANNENSFCVACFTNPAGLSDSLIVETPSYSYQIGGAKACKFEFQPFKVSKSIATPDNP